MEEETIEGREYQITHEEFIEGITEIIELSKAKLKALNDNYTKTKNPISKSNIEEEKEVLIDVVDILQRYINKREVGIELQPIVVFTDSKALFGFKDKKSIEFSKKWYDKITNNGGNLIGYS